MYILIVIVCSVTFVVYVLVLDVVAVVNRHTIVTEALFFNPVAHKSNEIDYGALEIYSS